jgi:hypothetical protein
MYEVPSRAGVARVVVNRDTVLDNTNPTLVPREHPTANGERRDKVRLTRFSAGEGPLTSASWCGVPQAGVEPATGRFRGGCPAVEPLGRAG